MMPSSALNAGRLSLNAGAAALETVDLMIDAGTPLIDVACQMARSPFRHLLVRTSEDHIAGVVTGDDLLAYLSRTDADQSEAWHTRCVESVMPVRFRHPDAEPETLNEEETASDCPQSETSLPDEIDCVPIVRDGRLMAVQTGEDLLLNWSLLQPVIRSATTDELTSLANRSMFQRRLAEEWARSQRYGEPLALMLIDLDHFKEINDSLGHLAGDAVLAELGACLRRTLRLYDVVARFGGDEFAALCCNCPPSGVDAPVRRLLEAARTLPVPVRQPGWRITLSIGVVVVTGGFDQVSMETAINAADDCLYASKLSGRNCAHSMTINGTSMTEPVLIADCDDALFPAGNRSICVGDVE